MRGDMLAARIKAPGELEVGREPAPSPGPGESLVRVGAVGLCGSDLHWFAEGGIGDARLSRPLVLGHEFGGVVEGGPLDGQAVAVDPAIPCGQCARCREGNANLCPSVRFAGHGTTDGGLQEYISWPTALLNPVPEGFSPATVALLEPLGVALHAFDLGHVRVGDEVAVVGCGPIGLMVVQVAKLAGARAVTAVEPLAHRRSVAARSGADRALSPEEAAADPLQVDVCFEVAGTNDAVSATMALVRPGGRVVLAGIPDDDSTVVPASVARRKGLTVRWARRMNDAYPRAIDMVRRHVIELDHLVSHRFGLAQAPEAFELASRRVGLKTVIEVG